MKKKVLMIVFIAIILCVTVLKHAFVCDLPIVANVELGVDDGLMINITKSLLKGEWVGNYNDVVLSKGITFPLVLAACYSLGIDYITMMSVLYTLACLIVMIVISKKEDNKFFLGILYTVLLFTPIMYSYQVMQRIYRNAIIPSFALFIVSGYIYLLISRNDTKFWKRFIASILTGIILALFWYTREDSIWMIPFIGFMSLSLIISVLVKNKKINRELFKNLLLLIIPIIMILGYRHIICTQNEKHFDVYTVYNNESYKKAMKSLKKVKKYDYYDNIDYTTAKLKKVAEVTCLKEVYGTLEGLVIGYSAFDSSPEEGEVANGWFPWALKAALNQNGYYANVQNTNLFYNTLHNEIEEALADGRLEYEDVKPSVKKQLLKLWDATILTIKGVLKYDDIYIYGVPMKFVPGFEGVYQDFYEYTGNKFILYDTKTLENVNLTENPNGYIDMIKEKTLIVEYLIKVYQKVNLVLFIMASLMYLVYTIIIFKGVIKKDFSKLEMWVIISGILGAMLTLIMGIAYETAFNAYVITAMYLSAVYSLMLLFSILMIGEFIKVIYEIIKKKKELISEMKQEEKQVNEN